MVEGDSVRFSGEHAPGIPASIAITADLGALFGYYCAEGCVVKDAKRPNSHDLNFSFGPREGALAERTRALLKACLGVEAQLVKRHTTLGVVVGKASAALLFEALAGGRSSEKQVPSVIAVAPLDVVEAFLDAYVEGDGHRYSSGKVSATTVSRALAHGIAWLVLRAGHLPSIYETAVDPLGVVQGRSVNRAPVQYTVVWYPEGNVRRRMAETPEHYLVPIRSVKTEAYEGDVYNLEVEEEHSYLAGFFAVSNCQNWLTSQTLRDPAARAPAQEVERRGDRDRREAGRGPYRDLHLQRAADHREWAHDVFRLARPAGLLTSFVSNGNATAEVLDYLSPLPRRSARSTSRRFIRPTYRGARRHAGRRARHHPRPASSAVSGSRW